MASDITPDNIDGEYPVAGISNDTQGFRNNFANISTNFTFAASEIEDLQVKAIVKAPLDGNPSADNDMQGTQFKSATIIDQRIQVYDHETVTGSVVLDHANGHYQTMSPSDDITLTLTGFPSNAQQLGLIRVEINIADTADTVDLTQIPGYPDIRGLEFIEGAGATIEPGQTQLDYDGAGSNGVFTSGVGLTVISGQTEVEISTFSGGASHVALDVITMLDGSTVRVDTVAVGVVTEFTVLTKGILTATAGDSIIQSSSSGPGTGFAMSPDLIDLEFANPYIFGDKIILNSGTVITVTEIGIGATDAGNVTKFTVDAGGSGEAVAGVTLLQGSTTDSTGLIPGTGTGFNLTPEVDNISPEGKVAFADAGYYTFEFTSYDNAFFTIADLTRSGSGGSGSSGSINDLTDVSTAGAISGDVLTFVGGVWVNSDTGAKSAYESAVDPGGFVGTELEWTDSLNGADGADGAIGPTGLDGPIGPQGDPGIQGTQGLQGIQGEEGPPIAISSTIPPTSKGLTGDRNGDLAYDSSYLYVCYLNWDPTIIAGQDETDYAVFVGGDGIGASAYSVSDVITLVSGATITVDGVAGNGDVTTFTVSSESTGVVSAGVIDPQLTTSATLITAAQDETNFDGAGSNGVFVGGDGLGGTDHAIGNVVTLSNGATITVDAVDGGTGDVTAFTLGTQGSSVTVGVTLTQAATTGTGTLFSLTPGFGNVDGGFDFSVTPESANLFGGGGVGDIWARSLLDISAF